jgi:hypothetical protein
VVDETASRRALDEIRRLGAAGSIERSAEQTTVARFWSDQPVAKGQRALRDHAVKLGWGRRLACSPPC